MIPFVSILPNHGQEGTFLTLSTFCTTLNFQKIIGKRFRKQAPAGRGKLRREFRVPISRIFACLSSIPFLQPQVQSYPDLFFSGFSGGSFLSM